MQKIIFLALCSVLFYACASSRFDPNQKYSRDILESEFDLLRNVLQDKHPSLNWYTPADSMSFYFEHYRQRIKDSMTSMQFAWRVLAPLVDKIHCGHTSVSMSKAYGKWVSGKRFASFPYYLKTWNDSMAVVRTLLRDSFLARGTLIHSINGVHRSTLVDSIFEHLPEDGYANNINYIRISANFPYYHRNIFGVTDTFLIGYYDSSNNILYKKVPAFKPVVDTTDRTAAKKDTVSRKPVRRKPSREQRMKVYRELVIDSSKKFAVMEVNRFTKGHLRNFFRRSFRQLKRDSVNNLILDLRSNSGGRIALSTLLTRYISKCSFRVADSVYTPNRSLAPYTRYFENRWLNNLQIALTTRKMKDGKYHLRHYENKCYKPKKKNHFSGNVYVLINGPTFSAATLVANVLKGQDNIVLVGEEAGGGWHGNNGIILPEFRLPVTGTRVTIPLFRVVQFNHVPKNGMGVPPDVYVGTHYPSLIRGGDYKMQVVTNWILNDEGPLATANKED